jgi:hypothetical protein
VLKLCRVDIEKSKRLLEAVDKYARKVAQALNPYAIILFGSASRGDLNEASDVDMLVVADFKEEFLDRMGVLMDLNDLGIPLEPVGYTPGELHRMKAAGNAFILEVLEKGKVLFRKEGYSL